MKSYFKSNSSKIRGGRRSSTAGGRTGRCSSNHNHNPTISSKSALLTVGAQFKKQQRPVIMFNKYEVDPSLSFGYEIDQNVLYDTTSEDLLKVTGDADGSAGGTDVHHTTSPRSGAGGDLPPRVGEQDVAAATTTNPTTTTVTKSPTLAGKMATKPRDFV